MVKRPGFMIVSGNGRNTGKTSFVERVIKHNSNNYSITALKVSPHIHNQAISKKLLVSDANFRILEEKDKEGTKDSSRMLRAGAKRVYYIESKDLYLQEAFQHLLQHDEMNGPVICESGGLRQLIEPSLFILLTRPDQEEKSRSFKKLAAFADHIVYFHNNDFDVEPENVVYDGKRWKRVET